MSDLEASVNIEKNITFELLLLQQYFLPSFFPSKQRLCDFMDLYLNYSTHWGHILNTELIMYYFLKVSGLGPAPMLFQRLPLSVWKWERMLYCTAPYWTKQKPLLLLLKPHLVNNYSPGTGNQRAADQRWSSVSIRTTCHVWNMALGSVIRRCLLSLTGLCCCEVPDTATQRFITAASAPEKTWTKTEPHRDEEITVIVLSVLLWVSVKCYKM